MMVDQWMEMFLFELFFVTVVFLLVVVEQLVVVGD